MQSPRVPLVFNLLHIKASAFCLFPVNSPFAHCTYICSSRRIRILQEAFPAKRQLLGCWWQQVRTQVLLTTHPRLTGSLRVYEMFSVGVKAFSSVSASAELIHMNSYLLGEDMWAPTSKKVMPVRYLLLYNNPYAGLSPHLQGIFTNWHY